MSPRITLIEYDEDIYDGDDVEPGIQDTQMHVSPLGGDPAAQSAGQQEDDRIDAMIEIQLADLHAYLIGISSSSSSSESSSSSSSSSSS